MKFCSYFIACQVYWCSRIVSWLSVLLLATVHIPSSGSQGFVLAPFPYLCQSGYPCCSACLVYYFPALLHSLWLARMDWCCTKRVDPLSTVLLPGAVGESSALPWCTVLSSSPRLLVPRCSTSEQRQVLMNDSFGSRERWPFILLFCGYPCR